MPVKGIAYLEIHLSTLNKKLDLQIKLYIPRIPS